MEEILLKDLSFSELVDLREYFFRLKDQVLDTQGIPRINNLNKAFDLKEFDFDAEVIYLDRYITGKYTKIKNISINKQ
jgi:hypothetical protein